MSLHDIWLGDVMPQSGVEIAIGRNSFDPPAPVVPIFDIHNRTYSLHDNDASGIISHNGIDKHLNFIPGGSGVQTIVPGAVIYAYASIEFSIGLGSFTAMGLLTELFSTVPDAYTVTAGLSGMITVHEAGVYDIGWRFSMRNSNTVIARFSPRTFLQKISPSDNETGFVEIPGTTARLYLRSVNFRDSSTARCIITCKAGDIVQPVLRGAGAAPGVAGVYIIENASNITIERLE